MDTLYHIYKLPNLTRIGSTTNADQAMKIADANRNAVVLIAYGDETILVYTASNDTIYKERKECVVTKEIEREIAVLDLLKDRLN